MNASARPPYSAKETDEVWQEPTLVHSGDEFDDDDFDEGPSKTQRKKAMHALQELAVTLTELPKDRVKTMPIDEDFRDLVLQSYKLRSHEARRRHLQYLGKIIRRLDEEGIEAIRQAIDVIQGNSKALTVALHRIERLRENLIKHDHALTELIDEYPEADVSTLRTLIRNARKEAELNKPPKAYRELFQHLKALTDAPQK